MQARVHSAGDITDEEDGAEGAEGAEEEPKKPKETKEPNKMEGVEEKKKKKEATMRLHKRMEAVKLQAKHVMAGIVPCLCSTVARTPQHLTDAVRGVFMECPAHLEWEQCAEITGC